MDAAFYLWFGDKKTALHLSVDRATSIFLAGYFDYEKTTEAYLILLYTQSVNYVFPKGIKTDRRNSFSINNARNYIKN